VIAGVLAFSVWSFYPVARVQYREERQKAKLEAEYTALKERNARLSKAVARLRTPEGVEDVARENLGLVKQGEHAVVVVDPNADTTTAAGPVIDSEPEVSAPRGPWTAALDAFFGYHE
jgi:cell division protein FtsB